MISKQCLSVSQLVKTFPSKKLWGKRNIFTAVNGISFSLHEGEILGFLGTNGAGKTTTIQMLLGLMTPTSGSIEYFGLPFHAHAREILKTVTFASTYVSLPDKLTIYENLDIYGRLYDMPNVQRKERIAYLLKLFQMWDIRDKDTGVLSAGQTSRVMLAKAFLPRPKIILLDEPTVALDPHIAFEIRAFIVQQQKEYGASILFTSHNMNEVTQMCDRILVLQRGTIIADSTAQQLASSVKTARVHLLMDEHNAQKGVAYAQAQRLIFCLNEKSLEIDVQEHELPALLHALALNGIQYTNIYIDVPTLEDYFIHISKQQREVNT